MRAKALRPIKKGEWEKYEWIDVSEPDNAPCFLRGIENNNPPDDGFVYINRTRLGESKRRWERAKTYAEEA